MAKKKKPVNDVVTNKMFASKDELFRKACSNANVEPTKRQASKFRRGMGLAFKFRNKEG